MKELRYTIRLEESFDAQWERFTFPACRPLYRRLGSGTIPDTEDRPFALTASAGSRRVGLLLGCEEGGLSGQFRIHSLYVAPPWRRKGIGHDLWARAEAWCAGVGGEKLSVNYVAGKSSVAYIERILARRGWSPSKQSMLVIKTHLGLATQASWYKVWQLPENYRIESWATVSEEDKAEILESHARNAWIAEDLIPFRYLPDHHLETSLALYRDDRVRGWLINHLVGRVLRYTCSFVHPELQRKGRVFALYSEAMRRMQQLGLEEGMWTVPTSHPAMQAFAQRWMQPFSTSFRESRDSSKKLIS